MIWRFLSYPDYSAHCTYTVHSTQNAKQSRHIELISRMALLFCLIVEGYATNENFRKWFIGFGEKHSNFEYIEQRDKSHCFRKLIFNVYEAFNRSKYWLFDIGSNFKCHIRHFWKSLKFTNFLCEQIGTFPFSEWNHNQFNCFNHYCRCEATKIIIDSSTICAYAYTKNWPKYEPNESE